MSKKNKRQIRRDSPVPMSVAVAGSQESRGTTDFHPDYSYIRSDLRRIGAIAGSFFVIFIILSFFLH